MERDLGWSRAALTGAFSLALLCSGFAGPLIGRWVDRHGPRVLMTLGSTVAALLLLAWSRVASEPVFLLIFVGLGLAMGATLYEPAFAAIATWFSRYRARALTIITFHRRLRQRDLYPADLPAGEYVWLASGAVNPCGLAGGADDSAARADLAAQTGRLGPGAGWWPWTGPGEWGARCPHRSERGGARRLPQRLLSLVDDRLLPGLLRECRRDGPPDPVPHRPRFLSRLRRVCRRPDRDTWRCRGGCSSPPWAGVCRAGLSPEGSSRCRRSGSSCWS